MGFGETAGQVVQAYVSTEVDRLLEAVPGLRAGDDDAVHDARVATRRLRAALSVYRPVLDRAATDPLRDELADLGHVLGAARDAFIEHQALLLRLVHEDPALVVGPIVQRVDEDRAAARQLAFDLVEGWLASERFPALIDGLTGGLAVGPRADEDSAAVVPGRARRAWRRLDRAIETARATRPGEEHDDALHEVRKAARRARYASEVAAASVGKRARRSARRAHELQDLLGAQHDAVVRRETLRRLSLQAELDGESTFTYGRLHTLEQVAADEAEQAAGWAVERVTARRHRRWMR